MIPKIDASSAASDVFQIVLAIPCTSDPIGRTSCLIEAIYLYISFHREEITALDAFGLICWIANISEGSDNPSQMLDAISTTSRAYANKNIMILEPIPAAPILGTSDLLAFSTNNETTVFKHTFQATRKLDRANQSVCVQLNSDVSDVMRCFVQARVLLSYGTS